MLRIVKIAPLAALASIVLTRAIAGDAVIPNAASFVTFSVAGAASTYPVRINSSGTVVGNCRDSGNALRGFLKDSAGNITVFDAPGAATGNLQGTAPNAINSSGVVTGSFIDASAATHGFVRYAAGNFVTFDAPGVGTGPGQLTVGADINDSG